MAIRRASTFSARSSPSAVWKWTGIPSAPSSRLSHWLFVSSDWPLTSSLPIATISAIIRNASGRRAPFFVDGILYAEPRPGNWGRDFDVQGSLGASS